MPKKRWEVRKLTEEPVLGFVEGSVDAAAAEASRRFAIPRGEVVLRQVKLPVARRRSGTRA